MKNTTSHSQLYLRKTPRWQRLVVNETSTPKPSNIRKSGKVFITTPGCPKSYKRSQAFMLCYHSDSGVDASHVLSLCFCCRRRHFVNTLNMEMKRVVSARFVATQLTLIRFEPRVNVHVVFVQFPRVIVQPAGLALEQERRINLRFHTFRKNTHLVSFSRELKSWFAWNVEQRPQTSNGNKIVQKIQ